MAGVDQELLNTYHDTARELYAFVSRRAGGRRELSEDLVQEVYLRALAAWKRDGMPREPLAWLKATARNLLLNYFRRREPERLSTDELADLLEGECEVSRAPLIQFGLAAIRPKDRALIEAFHLEGRDTRSIAKELRLSERAVEGRLFRARKKLARVLAPYVDESVPVVSDANPLEMNQ